jgi:hypothetical protein
MPPILLVPVAGQPPAIPMSRPPMQPPSPDGNSMGMSGRTWAARARCAIAAVVPRNVDSLASTAGSIQGNCPVSDNSTVQPGEPTTDRPRKWAGDYARSPAFFWSVTGVNKCNVTPREVHEIRQQPQAPKLRRASAGSPGLVSSRAKKLARIGDGKARSIGDGEARFPGCIRYDRKSMAVRADRLFRSASQITPRCNSFDDICRSERSQVDELHAAVSQRQGHRAAARSGAKPTQLTADGGNTVAACAIIDDGVFVAVQDRQHPAIQRERRADQWLAVVSHLQHLLP